MVKPITWVLLPIGAVIFAVLIMAISTGPGLDGAAKSTAVIFWFLPTIIWLAYMSFSNLGEVKYSNFSKVILVSIWLIPSIPLGLMSLMGILLLSDVGFGILF